MTSTGTRRAFLILVGFVLFGAAPCIAQEAATVKIDKFVKGEMRWRRIPGVSLLVAKNGQIVLAKGYGFANVEHQVAVRPETIFQSGSLGKQFTATAVMMLVEEGKIDLDDKIAKYIGPVPETWSNITVRHLLTHTSGMTGYPADFDFRRDYSEEELLKRAFAVPLAFRPGEKWRYSNLGYVTLGILIHKVSGKFYGDYLQEKIFKPLGMVTARIISESDIIPNRAAGYRMVEGELKNQQWVSPSLNSTADGALYMNVLDMAKWDAALYDESLLRKASLEQMWTPVKLPDGKIEPYGFGWYLGEINKHRIIEHGGSWQGFQSFIARYPDKRLTVIVFANLARSNPGRIAHGVAALYEPALAPTPVKAIEDKEPKITDMVKELLQEFAGGRFRRDLFAPETLARITPDRSRVLGENLKSLGRMREIELLQRRGDNDRQIYRYRVIYDDAVLSFSMNLNKDGKIILIDVQPE